MSTTIDSPDPDVVYMRQAMTLASRGQGKVEPNPMVGCILVKKGRLIGQGYHRRFGGPHAEVYALRQAGPAARGATAYVTLEPCSHHGKTPPCADALIQAGVSRVVVAMKDPFPQVAGRGIRRLRRAGVKVSVGLCHEEAARLNAPYLTVLQRDRPYVILKWAQSLDGCIATRTGNSKWISSPLSRRWVHRLRARVDGILVGINTVLKDDPLLTARDVPIRRVATRIVLDTRLRLPARSQLVQTAAQIPLVVCTTGRALNQNTNRARRLERAGVHFLPCRTHKNRIALPDVLERLAKQKVTN
ncbi:MAG: bifunctional diaminohydroxyphosphoribosylaminopyrimidine deaminase/5-amino-6-(5-phosphoribosylamino)uracil reductase RibD, partial [Phycisphaerae bacterium]